MNIGIDIDGVLTDLSSFYLDYGSMYYYNKGTYIKNPNEYHFKDIFKVNQKEDDDFWTRFINEYCLNTPPRRFASEIIKKLKNEGNNIYLITSRDFLVSKTDKGNGKIDITKKWLENNDISYDKLVFSPHDKIPDIKKLNVDIMIEDSPINIESISKIIPVIAFDTRYNKDTKSKYRCYSWYDIYKTLTEYKK